MDFQVGLTEPAIDDLGAIVRFLAAKDPAAALRLGDELLDAALSLAILPRRGAPVRRRPGMRKLSHRYFLIFYQVNEGAKWIEVVRIWDGRRDPAKLKLP
jgi:plasmid stabilization system protein ParE